MSVMLKAAKAILDSGEEVKFLGMINAGPE